MADHTPALDGGLENGSRLDGFIAGILRRRLADVPFGRLRLTLPSGHRVEIGSGAQVEAALKLNSYAVVRRALRRGLIGFAESYMNREVETPDLGNVMRFFLANFAKFDTAGGGWFRTRVFERLRHRSRSNTKAGSRRNISAHYDLGNAFYGLWLDETMTYSSALFENGDESLEAAQNAKLKLVIDALGVSPGERVLEIGCGWGTVAKRLANAGGDVTAITVSREQLDYARNAIAAEGLQRACEVRFQDYRDVRETFDKVISVEMIEAVGEEHWPTYFKQIRDRLKPGGTAIVQAITIQEESYESYRRHPDFIQHYIFPGGMLPTVTLLSEHARKAGLEFGTVRRFGQSYAETLRAWRKRFLAAWPEIEALGFDDRFRRMWLYYLTYCEVGFETGLIDVGVYRFERPA